MTVKYSEKKMVGAVANLMRRKGCGDILLEAQFCERFIDLYCFNQKNKKYIAVEAKVKSPGRAFRQAQRYKYASDYVYVAIMENGKNERAIELAQTTGIGLIFVKRDKLNRYSAYEAHTAPRSNERVKRFIDLVWKSNVNPQ